MSRITMSKNADAADFALQAGKPSCDSNTFFKKIPRMMR